MPGLARLLRVPHVDSLFDIAPDDSKIAFAWNKTGEWQIYEIVLIHAEQTLSPRAELAEAEGEVEVEAHPLTAGVGGKFNPRYSPDGKQLAYVMDLDGSENYHLVVYDFESRQLKHLTPDISWKWNCC